MNARMKEEERVEEEVDDNIETIIMLFFRRNKSKI